MSTNRNRGRALSVYAAALAVAIVVGMGAAVAAQNQEQERTAEGRRRFNWETRVTKTAETYGVADLSGTWAVTRREKPVNAAICDKHTDKRGLPRNPCRFNADLLNLTKRAYAWLDFHDEKIEGKYYCVPESIPSLLVRDYPVRIDQRMGRVTFGHTSIPATSRSITATPWASTRGTISWLTRGTSCSIPTGSTT